MASEKCYFFSDLLYIACIARKYKALNVIVFNLLPRIIFHNHKITKTGFSFDAFLKPQTLFFLLILILKYRQIKIKLFITLAAALFKLCYAYILFTTRGNIPSFGYKNMFWVRILHLKVVLPCFIINSETKLKISCQHFHSHYIQIEFHYVINLIKIRFSITIKFV